MTPDQFIDLLKGFAELSKQPPTQAQWDLILGKLKEVKAWMSNQDRVRIGGVFDHFPKAPPDLFDNLKKFDNSSKICSPARFKDDVPKHQIPNPDVVLDDAKDTFNKEIQEEIDKVDRMAKNLPIPFEPVLAKIYVKGCLAEYTYADIIEHNGKKWTGERFNSIKDGGEIQQWIYVKDIFK